MRIIRKVSLPADGERIMEIFAAAKKIMRNSGNMHQWGDGYPSLETVKTDVEQEGAYVVVDAEQIVGYFAFLPSPEPTYSQIYEGQWQNAETPYHVVHRIASIPEAHGVFQSIMDFCFSHDNNIRIDTHRDNHVMQHVISKCGFTYCGIIYLASGDERLAYQRISKKNSDATCEKVVAITVFSHRRYRPVVLYSFLYNIVCSNAVAHQCSSQRCAVDRPFRFG